MSQWPRTRGRAATGSADAGSAATLTRRGAPQPAAPTRAHGASQPWSDGTALRPRLRTPGRKRPRGSEALGPPVPGESSARAGGGEYGDPLPDTASTAADAGSAASTRTPDHGSGNYGDAFQLAVGSTSLVVLPEGTRKEKKKARDRLRATAHRKGMPYPKSVSPSGFTDPPQLCNRVASPWGSTPSKCDCKSAWPAFISQAVKNGAATVAQSIETSDGTLDTSVEKPTASYYRPGSQGSRWWYDAIVVKAYTIHGHGRFKDFQVAAVN